MVLHIYVYIYVHLFLVIENLPCFRGRSTSTLARRPRAAPDSLPPEDRGGGGWEPSTHEASLGPLGCLVNGLSPTINKICDNQILVNPVNDDDSIY